MVPFSDIMQFAQAHRPCGEIVPAIRPESDGGYLLTLTCTCGTVVHRHVTPEEAAHVPIAGATPTAPDRAARARPGPSPELERAMQQALEAEEQAAAPIPAPERKTRRIERSQALEDVLREALAAEDAAAAPAPLPRAASSPAATSSTRAIAPLAASTFQDTLKAALLEQEQLKYALGAGTASRPRSRARWISVVLFVAMIAGGAAFYVAGTFESDARMAAPSSNAPSDGSSASEAPTYGNAVMALRRLQAASIPTTSLPAYAARVSEARGVVARYMDTDAPSDAKGSLRAILDLHLLAFTAWQARSIDSAAAWEPVARSATLELCDPVNNAAYIAERSGQSPAQARGRAIAGSISLLWDCAARRLAQLDTAR